MTEEKQTSVAVIAQAESEAVLAAPTAQAIGFGTMIAYGALMEQAREFAKSSLIPKEFQGNPSNCAIALNMAFRMDCDPLMVMQSLYIVYGKPGWSSQFLIAMLNKRGKFEPLKYEFRGTKADGDSYGCRAWTTLKGDGAGPRIEGAWIDIKLARQEGWYDRKSQKGECASKWPTMTAQMLMYRAAAWFIRIHAPEVALGFRTSDELEDIGPRREKNITSQSEVIEKTQQKPASLEGLVDADKSKKSSGLTPPPAIPPSPPVPKPPAASAPFRPQASRPVPPSSPPGGNPNYAEGSDQDPAYEKSLFGNRDRIPGEEG
jgi:hypothetical protein